MSFQLATWEPGNIAQIHELRLDLSVSNWDKARAFLLPDRSVGMWLVTLLLLAFGAFLLFMDMVNGGPHPYYTAIRLAATTRAQMIRGALEHYAKDHNGEFPSGRNSTEFAGSWKQYSGWNVFGFFRLTSSLFRWENGPKSPEKSENLPAGILLP